MKDNLHEMRLGPAHRTRVLQLRRGAPSGLAAAGAAGAAERVGGGRSGGCAGRVRCWSSVKQHQLRARIGMPCPLAPPSLGGVGWV